MIVYIDRLTDQHVGQEVTLRGWVYNRTDKGRLCFLMIRDGTGLMQAVVFRNDVDEATWATCTQLTQESSVAVTGTVRADKRAIGGYELSVKSLQLIHRSADYPIALKEHGSGFLMQHRHLWLRSRRPHATLRVRAAIIRACREFLDNHGYVNVDSPILTANACEGTTTLFETTYYDLGKAYLSQSGQLYNEAHIMALGRVYCFGPTFRAEKSKTRRHLSEFWMIEPEAAFMEFEELLAFEEQFITYIVQYVLKHCQTELATLERNTAPLEKIVPPFPRLTYDQAIQIIAEKYTEVEECRPLAWGDDLGAPHETLLTRQFEKPVFITHFPAKVKAFYMQPDPARPEVVLAADLLAPEDTGEIIGGSQRIHDLALLEQRLAEYHLPREAFEWYLDLRRYGTVPHSGFGMGIERMVKWLCGLPNIQEAIPFPRTLERIYP